ncbi:MAG: SGNH/GDSL hydrolase family protein [Bdellovibrionales bacterium]
MARILLSVFFLFSLGACKQNARTVLVAGDSWASFICTYKSLDVALRAAGISDASMNSTCLATTRAGVQASNWLDKPAHQATEVALLDPSVQVVFLSLGGNDLLGEWNLSMSESESQALLRDFRARVARTVDLYRKQRPDVKILISGYDFPHFNDFNMIAEYREVYARMGKPTTRQLNEVLAQFSTEMVKLADQKNVFYVHYVGLMHYYYGNGEGGLRPFSTLVPQFISPPSNPAQFGGDLSFQTDSRAMLNSEQVGFVDPFHLSRAGYERLAEHAVRQYLRGWLATR